MWGRAQTVFAKQKSPQKPFFSLCYVPGISAVGEDYVGFRHTGTLVALTYFGHCSCCNIFEANKLQNSK